MARMSNLDKVYAAIPADGTPISLADLWTAAKGKGNRVDFISNCLVRLHMDGKIEWDEEHAKSFCWEQKGNVWRVVTAPVVEEAPVEAPKVEEVTTMTRSTARSTEPGTVFHFTGTYGRTGTITIMENGTYRASSSGLGASFCTRFASARAYLTKYLGKLTETAPTAPVVDAALGAKEETVMTRDEAIAAARVAFAAESATEAQIALLHEEAERLERQAQGFSEADISAIMQECPNTAEAYRTDRMVLRAMERIIGTEALGDARMYRAGTGPEAGTLGADALHGVYYRMTVADYAFSFAYVNGGEDGRAWRTVVRSLVDVPGWTSAGEVMEIMDRYAGDWQDAITSVKAMYLRGVEGVTLTGADVALLLAGDDEWTLEDEGSMETVLECKRCGGRERFQTAEAAYDFANGEASGAEEHLHVAHAASAPAGAAERYTVKVKGAAPEAYAIDGGPFDAFAALVVLAQSVSKAENTIAYVRDNQHGGIAIAFESGEQVAPHKAWAEVRPFV